MSFTYRSAIHEDTRATRPTDASAASASSAMTWAATERGIPLPMALAYEAGEGHEEDTGDDDAADATERVDREGLADE